jgi:ADP-heptose:LPS heptosyltransferase
MPSLSSAANSFKFILIRKLIPVILYMLFFFALRRKKTLLVVKCDGIGDYLLFRNYLYFLKTSERYRHHKIYLLANTGSKDIACHLDSKIVDGFYWYSDSFFLKWELVKLMYALQRLRVETIIYPNYSRKYSVDELIKNVKAIHKIAVDGDLINESAELKKKADNFYSRLIHVNTAPLHEFERNKQIMEAFAGEKCHLKAPEIGKDNFNITPYDGVIIFTGASVAGKRWSATNFNKLCMLISSETDTDIMVISGKNEDQETTAIGKGIAQNKISVQTSVSLVRLCELIGSARALVSGDTVAIHIAAALSVPVVCIAKGDLYGRFIPYPRHISEKIHVVFPDRYITDSKNHDRYSPFDTNDVRVADVYLTVKKILTDQENETT